MATEKELGLKLVYKIADNEVKCDVCGKTIAIGAPYAIKSKTQIRGERIVLLEESECLTQCSIVMKGLMDCEDEGDNNKRVMTYHSMWDTEPEIARLNESRRLVTERQNVWVANGYSRLVPLGTSLFIECRDQQVQKHAFALDPKNRADDGAYESWVSSDGMRVREYKRDSGYLRAGYWYFPASWVVLAPTIQTPEPRTTIGDALKSRL